MRARGKNYFGGDVAALVILGRAWQEAGERRADVWQHAVGRSHFEAAGVPLDDLDRLRRAGLVAAREERTCGPSGTPTAVNSGPAGGW
jgi:hypothetical protein